MKSLIIRSNQLEFDKVVNSWFIENNCDVFSLQNGFEEVSKLYKLKKIINFLIKTKKDKYKKIIIFDNYFIFFLLSVFGFPNTYLWLWNSLDKSLSMKLFIKLLKKLNPIYTFDINDSIFFDIKLNTQFYQKQSIDKKNKCIKVFFSGTDKGRSELIIKIAKIMDSLNVRYLFQIISCNKVNYSNHIEVHSNFVPYNEILANVVSSDTILDICKDGQSGMTIRAMEALFYNKKIITNNSNYYNLPFYNKNSIFVINNNNTNRIGEFLKNEPHYDKKFLVYYSIQSWLNRFNEME